MPELPEVETVARALRPCLLGRRIVDVRTHTAGLRRSLRLRGRREIVGRTIRDVRRRAKYLVVEFDGCHVLVIHLGMTGACRICPTDKPRRKHEHIIWTLDNGLSWRFEDARRFGMVEVHAIATEGEWPACLAGLPPEPLEASFDAQYLAGCCRGRRRPIKTLLMDADLVAGVGNIYASEGLFRSGIRPRRAAGRLTRKEIARLVIAIREVLADAIAAGGTTISNFRNVDGSTGRFRPLLFVYDRAGEPCRRCETVIKRVVLSGRSTYYCPACQR